MINFKNFTWGQAADFKAVAPISHARYGKFLKTDTSEINYAKAWLAKMASKPSLKKSECYLFDDGQGASAIALPVGSITFNEVVTNGLNAVRFVYCICNQSFAEKYLDATEIITKNT